MPQNNHSKQSSASPSFFQKLIESLTGVGSLRLEKTRLESFLDAVPGEYCAFFKTGDALYSAGFLKLIGRESISSIHDVQLALTTGDSSALEGMLTRLEDKKTPFSIDVETAQPSKLLRLSGNYGRSIAGSDDPQILILWAQDITDEKRALDSLQKSTNHAQSELAHFQSVLDTLPVPLWQRNENGALIWCNFAYAGLVNTTPAAVLVQQKEISVTARGGKPPREMAQLALDTGEAQEQTGHVIAGGARRLIKITEQPVPGTSRTLGFLKDLTHEEELKAEHERHSLAHKALLEQLSTAIGIFDGTHQLSFYNTAFSRLWGLEEQWLNTKPTLEDILERLRETRRLPEQADFKSYKKTWIDMFTQLIDPHEDMLYLPDGSAIRMLIVPHPMGGLMSLFEDVTSNLELESSYNTLIAVQRETLDHLAEGVSVYGGDGRLKLWNPSFLKLWNLNPEDLEGEPHISQIVTKMGGFFDPEHREESAQNLTAQAISRQMQDGRIHRNDGTLLAYTTVPLPDGGGLVTHFDITDTMRVENALREKNTALEAAEQLKTDFLANVSYQLRTPLSSIMGFAEILDQQYFGQINEKQREYTQGIQESGHRLLSLIDDILDLATIEAGYLSLEKDNVDLYPVLENLHELTQNWARKEKIEVYLECAKDIGTVYIDERRIKQALLNLIRNAIHFTPRGGKITLGAFIKGDKLYMNVVDTGIGLSLEAQKRIFEPFERIQIKGEQNLNKDAGRGAGLGLSIVQNIAELHGGHVNVESAEGKGATFTLCIPCTESGENKTP